MVSIHKLTYFGCEFLVKFAMQMFEFRFTN